MNKNEILSWLLGEDNPSVRYFALRDLCGLGEEDTRILAARRAIMQSGPVPRILEKQKPGGYWFHPEDFYLHSKYKGTVWSVILLAELGASGDDPRVQAAGEFLLQHAQDHFSGGFSHKTGGMIVETSPGIWESPGGDADGIIPCLTGNLVWSLLRLNRPGPLNPTASTLALSDRRVQLAIDWIATYQRFDDGNGFSPVGWPYHFEKCWGRHTCMMGVVKALKALAEIPVDMRSLSVCTCIEKGCEYLLNHQLFKRSHDLTRPARQEWATFGFPTFWSTDALEMLEILIHLGVRDERMQPALDLLLSKRDDQGRWRLERSFDGRMLVRLEPEGAPSKWITLKVLRILHFYKIFVPG